MESAHGTSLSRQHESLGWRRSGAPSLTLSAESPRELNSPQPEESPAAAIAGIASKSHNAHLAPPASGGRRAPRRTRSSITRSINGCNPNGGVTRTSPPAPKTDWPLQRPVAEYPHSSAAPAPESTARSPPASPLARRSEQTPRRSKARPTPCEPAPRSANPNAGGTPRPLRAATHCSPAAGNHDRRSPSQCRRGRGAGVVSHGEGRGLSGWLIGF